MEPKIDRQDLRGGLADLLKERTGPLHRQAERSGIIHDLLQGRAGRNGYGLLLRNLLPVYEALERGLDRQRNTPLLSPFVRPDLYRAAALRADLDHVSGPDWGSWPLLPAAQSYGRRILQAGVEDGALLIAHAYVRYLGDLNGGQILKRLLGRHLGLGPAGLTFYDFPTLADLQATAQDYRAAIDRAGVAIDPVEGVLNEACLAFRLTIDLSEEVASEILQAEQPPAAL
jgi:heme oxygenase